MAFVGEWYYSGNGNYSGWEFREDGTCYQLEYDKGEGTWSYDAEKKRLITTRGNFIWDIQLLTEDEWSGIKVGDKAYSYKRKSIAFTAGDIHGVWENSIPKYDHKGNFSYNETFKLTISASSYSFLYRGGPSNSGSGTCKINKTGTNYYMNIVLSDSKGQSTYLATMPGKGVLCLRRISSSSSLEELQYADYISNVYSKSN